MPLLKTKPLKNCTVIYNWHASDHELNPLKSKWL